MKTKSIILTIGMLGATSSFAQLKPPPSEIIHLQQQVQELSADMKVMQGNITTLFQELDKDYWTYRGVRKKVLGTIDKQQRLIDALQLTVQENLQAVNNSMNILDDALKQSTSSHQQAINDLQAKLESGNKVITNLQNTVDTTQKDFTNTASELDTKIHHSFEQTTTKLSALESNLQKNSYYYGFGLLALLLLAGITLLLLRRNMSFHKRDMAREIKNLQQSLTKESVILDHKLIRVLETQLALQQAEQQTKSAAPSAPDHSLALKVADEIVRMQKNIDRMDEHIKGVKPLIKGLERIQANLVANGYEMVALLGKAYEDRMNIDVINFIDDESLADGVKIISKIIRPQINYHGLLIQRAQVEVSQN